MEKADRPDRLTEPPKTTRCWRGCATDIDTRPTVFADGATQKLKVDGASQSHIKISGRSLGMGLRAYSHDQVADSLNFSRLVATAALSDSDDARVRRITRPLRQPYGPDCFHFRPALSFNMGDLDTDGGYRVPRAFDISGRYPDSEANSVFRPGERSSRKCPRIPGLKSGAASGATDIKRLFLF